MRASISKIALCSIPLLVLVSGCNREPEQAPRSGRPHVIVYLIDTLRADHLGAYGYDRATSPQLDRFAEQALTFETALASSSWTKSSVASLFTGMFPARHGALRREHRLRSDVATMAEILRADGYQTAAFVSNPNILPVFGFERGFDDFYDIESIERSATAEDVHASVLDYLDADKWNSDAPLFLYIHSRDPHDPYDPPKEFARRFRGEEGQSALARDRNLYDGEIAYNDDQIGKLFERLEKIGIYDNAYIAVISDHGEEFGDHGGTGHGKTLYREQLHIPFMFRLPGGRGGDNRISTPVRLLDLMPTLCELLDIEPPEAIDGRSFAGLMRPSTAEPYEPIHYAQLDLDRHLISSITTERYKLIERRLPAPDKGSLLFDKTQDPGETIDISAENPDVVAELSRQIAMIEAALTRGTYLEVANSIAVGSNLRMKGALQVTNGSVIEWSLEDSEDADHAELVGEKELRFDLQLANRPNPIGQEPLIIRDIDRLRFVVDPPEAIVTLSLEGEAASVFLGSATGELQNAPIDFRVGDASLSVPGSALTQDVRPPRPHSRLFSVAPPETAPAEIDKELDDRLRALGYVG